MKRHVRVLELAPALGYQNVEWIRGRRLTILCPPLPCSQLYSQPLSAPFCVPGGQLLLTAPSELPQSRLLGSNNGKLPQGEGRWVEGALRDFFLVSSLFCIAPLVFPTGQPFVVLVLGFNIFISSPCAFSPTGGNSFQQLLVSGYLHQPSPYLFDSPFINGPSFDPCEMSSASGQNTD